MAWPLLLFALVLLLIAFAVGIPVAFYKNGHIVEADAPVLGASVLVLALGGLNLAVLLAVIVGGEVGVGSAPFGLAPIVAGALGLRVVRRRLTGGMCGAYLVAAAVAVLAGVPGYFALRVAVVVTVIAAGLFLSGLSARPLTTSKAVFKALDPRV